MENSRKYFIDYLKRLKLHTPQAEALFDTYATDLQLANQFVNLFSRQMRSEEIWLKHFVDAVSIFEVYDDWSGKHILDFGTGGGIPGIPIHLLRPDSHLTLLDSIKKKIEAVRNIVQGMKLNNVEYIVKRLESRDMYVHKESFDIIVSRAIKVLPIHHKMFDFLLKKPGKVFLYKANVREDMSFFNNLTEHKLDLQELGERRIVEINYG